MIFLRDILKSALQTLSWQISIGLAVEEFFHKELESLCGYVDSAPVLELKHHLQETLA